MSISYTAELVAHYEKNWRQRATYRRLLRGPGHHLPRSFKVLEFPPGKQREVWTYATCGMSPPEDRHRRELHVFAPHESIEPVEILYETTVFHRKGTRLRAGASFNIGRPWMDRSKCSWGLVANPFLDGPKLEHLGTDDERDVTCLWLIPITRSERDYKVEFGIDALTSLFSERGVNFLDPERPSVV